MTRSPRLYRYISPRSRILSSCARLTSRPVHPQPSLSRRLATLHSLHLFRTHRYDLAVDAWIALDLTPAKVIALYPEAVSGKLSLESDAHEGLFGGRTCEQVKQSAASVQAAGEGEDDSGSVDGRLTRGFVGTAGTSPSKSSPSTSGFQAPLSSSPARSRRGGPPATALAKSGSADDDDAASIRTVASRFSTTLSGKKSWLKERDPTAALEEIAEHAARKFQKSWWHPEGDQLTMCVYLEQRRRSGKRSVTPRIALVPSTSSFGTSPTGVRNTRKLSLLCQAPLDQCRPRLDRPRLRTISSACRINL